MKNEITELRNQVRTLKRIVYGFGCLLVAVFTFGMTQQNSGIQKVELVHTKKDILGRQAQVMNGGLIYTTIQGMPVQSVSLTDRNGSSILGIGIGNELNVKIKN